MPDPIRILALDHFSAQDRDALIDRGGAGFAWRVIPFSRLRDVANRIFPPEVKGDLSEFARPELETQRRAYADWLHAEVRRLYRESPFDVMLLPSDTFYYVRGLPAICHELGIPVFVSQKETTITDPTLEVFARDVGAYAPFESDRMAVCSQRHKDFWLAAGADSALIEVTGQPRFDFYAQPPRSLSWESVGLPSHPRTVLFLSYEQDAYLVDVGYEGAGWHDLRGETEGCLFDAVSHGWRVVVKLHPMQHEENERRALAERAPGFGSDVVLVPSSTDTRSLIVLADAVVGFQTTALYEGMLAGKPVAYTAWGESYEGARSHLIPFGERPDLLDVIKSPDELSEWLRDPALPDDTSAPRRLAFVEPMLGPIDGHACDRTLALIHQVDREWREQRLSSPARHTLARTVRAAAALSLAEAAIRRAGIQGAVLAGALLPKTPRERLNASLAVRRARAEEQLRTARRTLVGRV